MDITLIVFEVLIIVGIVVGVFVFSQSASISTLKAQGKVAEIIKIALHEESNVDRREEAVAALGELATPEAQDALVSLLSTPSERIRKAAVNALGKVGEAVLPSLVNALRYPNSRQAAAQVLVGFGEPAIQSLVFLLKEPDKNLARSVAETLEVLGWQPGRDVIGAYYWIARRDFDKVAKIGVPAIEPLVQTLKDRDLRRSALVALSQIGDGRVVPPILALARERQWFQSAVEALAQLEQVAVPQLVTALRAHDSDIRQAAATALDMIGWQPGRDADGAAYWCVRQRWDRCVDIGGKAVGVLVGVLEERQSPARQAVIQALGQIKHEDALVALEKMLLDPDVSTQIIAVQALGKIGTARAAECLIPTLKPAATYAEALQALASIGQPAILPLGAALKNKDWAIRQGAAEALKKINWKPVPGDLEARFLVASQEWERCTVYGPAIVEPLIEALNSPACGQAAEVLGKIKDERAIEPLITALKEQQRSTQQMIALALGKFGDQAIPDLLTLMQEENLDKTLPIMALGATASPLAVQPLIEMLRYQTFSWPVHEAVAQALGQIGAPALAPLSAVLYDSQVNQRAAFMALGLMGQTALGLLENALHSKEVDTQIVVFALGKTHSEKAVPIILETLEVRKFGWQIRKSAVLALREVGAPAVPHLVRSLSNNRIDQVCVRLALVGIGSPAVNALVTVFKSSHYELREAIIEILGQIGDTQATHLLISAMKDPSMNRSLVNQALESIWRKQQQPGLDMFNNLMNEVERQQH
jgi:HEAT repeat protein